MREIMQRMALVSLVKAITAAADPVILKQFLDSILTFVEDYVKGTKSQIDDSLILPICDAARIAFGLVDYVPPEEVVSFGHVVEQAEKVEK
ncbi:MAG: hypothetical protein U9N86_09190 [Bacteroidota bacterium]|nr:hypothetical protein [Bacteroidota bacterium]